MYSSVNFDKCRQLCNHHHNTQISPITTRNPSASFTVIPLPPHPASGNHWSVFHPYSFAFSRMSYEWVKVVCSLWVWILSPSIMHLRFHAQGCVCISGLFLFIAERKVLVTQSCPTLWDPTDCSPPGFSVHVILKARILECVAIFFPRGYSQRRAQTQVSYIASKFLTIWATREALLLLSSVLLCG